MEDAQKSSRKGGSGSLTTPPARKVPAPSPKTPASVTGTRRKAPAPRVEEEKHGDKEDEEDEDEENEDEEGDEQEEPETTLTEAAKNNRLRRVCERKPSGKIRISQEIHDQWAKGGSERLALRDHLENCGWDKDWLFVS